MKTFTSTTLIAISAIACTQQIDVKYLIDCRSGQTATFVGAPIPGAAFKLFGQDLTLWGSVGSEIGNGRMLGSFPVLWEWAPPRSTIKFQLGPSITFRTGEKPAFGFLVGVAFGTN